jgi:hypothetical protein
MLSLTAPVLPEMARMTTPSKGCRVCSSFTVPDIFCATAGQANNNISARHIALIWFNVL